MKVFFLEKSNKIYLYKRILKPIELVGDKIKLNVKLHNSKLNRKVKIVRKIKSILDKNGVDKIIVSSNLKQDRDFLNLLYSNNIDIIDGKRLFKFLMDRIIENICKKNNIKSEEKQISILANSVDDCAVKVVETLSREFKSLNIVTSNPNQFINIKEKLWEDEGIIISITNNKKKALLKSDIILNIDFPGELINKYTIYDYSIIINVEQDIKIKKKRFSGKIINDYNIGLNKYSNIAINLEKEEFKNFDLKDLAEVFVLNNLEEIKNIIIL